METSFFMICLLYIRYYIEEILCPLFEGFVLRYSRIIQFFQVVCYLMILDIMMSFLEG